MNLVRWAVGLSIAALQACAGAPPALPGLYFSGRLSVRSEATDTRPAHAESGQFELSGDARRGQLLLTSPLGTAVARARWTLQDGGQGHARDDSIELEADGGTRRYATLEALTRDALGEDLPLGAMFDWLSGRPWPGSPAVVAADGAGFTQLGWNVDLSQFAAARLIEARRDTPAPPLRVRVKLDAPDTPLHVPAPSAAAETEPH